jgi:RNA-directed DNA polymerase
MMNGREKSDSAIVAMKPANNAGKPAAEWVEPRAGTKGNTGQPHTRRAQNRASVSQGLERHCQLAGSLTERQLASQTFIKRTDFG